MWFGLLFSHEDEGDMFSGTSRFLPANIAKEHRFRSKISVNLKYNEICFLSISSTDFRETIFKLLKLTKD
jgi:hypothetical protein